MYVRHTANPQRETNDCAIRSIANATGRPWQNVMRELCDIAIEMYDMPNSTRVIDEYFYNRKIFANQPSQPTNVLQFASEHPSGRFVVCLTDHAISIIDGDYYDLVDSGKGEIVDYYEVKGEV